MARIEQIVRPGYEREGEDMDFHAEVGEICLQEEIKEIWEGFIEMFVEECGDQGVGFLVSERGQTRGLGVEEWRTTRGRIVRCPKELAFEEEEEFKRGFDVSARETEVDQRDLDIFEREWEDH
jgi:hypothetical protein